MTNRVTALEEASGSQLEIEEWNNCTIRPAFTISVANSRYYCNSQLDRTYYTGLHTYKNSSRNGIYYDSSSNKIKRCDIISNKVGYTGTLGYSYIKSSIYAGDALLNAFETILVGQPVRRISNQEFGMCYAQEMLGFQIKGIPVVIEVSVSISNNVITSITQAMISTTSLTTITFDGEYELVSVYGPNVSGILLENSSSLGSPPYTKIIDL